MTTLAARRDLQLNSTEARPVSLQTITELAGKQPTQREKQKTLSEELQKLVGSEIQMKNGELWFLKSAGDHCAMFELRRRAKVKLPRGWFFEARLLRLTTILGA